MRQRVLYGRPVIQMPHIQWAVAQACARLTAMKLFAYRALDYVHSASADDRRYLLFCAVQKAKVSTEGVKVMALLSECIGARGFEAGDTYFEMALRDAQLIPLLESSAHINLGLTAGFMHRYFQRPDPDLAEPKLLAIADSDADENPFLMQARTGGLNNVAFPPYRRAYEPLVNVANVRLFCRQARLLRLLSQRKGSNRDFEAQNILALSQCFAIVAYGQLVAESAVGLNVPRELVSAIFHLLVADLSTAALALASSPDLNDTCRTMALRMVKVSKASWSDWDFVSNRLAM